MSLYVYSWACDESEFTTIRCYGIDENGHSIALIIPDFTPYVYIELPEDNQYTVLSELQNELGRMTIYTEITTKRHLYNNLGTRKFLLCQCKSRKYIAYISHLLKTKSFMGKRLELHEETATSILQLVSLRQIPMATWIDFSGAEVFDEDKVTCADREFHVKWTRLNKSVKTEQVHPKVLAFDLEVNSENENAMPSDKPDDTIFQISCVLYRLGAKQKFYLH